MPVHLTLAGKWVPCHATQRACPRLYHLDMDAAQARRIPIEFIDAVLGIEPGIEDDSAGNRVWQDSQGRTHRDYGLPAYVRADGSHSEWWRHGVRHRGGDQPAVVTTGGYSAWWRDGKLHRGNGKPAIIRPDGSADYWVDGLRQPDPPAATPPSDDADD